MRYLAINFFLILILLSPFILNFEHRGLIIRHRLFVRKPALILTAIALIGSLCVVQFLICYY